MTCLVRRSLLNKRLINRSFNRLIEAQAIKLTNKKDASHRTRLFYCNESYKTVVCYKKLFIITVPACFLMFVTSVEPHPLGGINTD